MAGNDLSKDQERLAKLWDAYEVQEKELELAMKNIVNLENKLKESDRVNSVLKKAVEDRDKEIRELEIKVIALEEEKSKFQPQLDEIQKLYNEEKERYSKLFAISEELEDDLAKSKKELSIKDKWFEKNVGMLENIRESIIDRNINLQKLEEYPKSVEEDEKASVTETAVEEQEQKEDEKDEKITFKTIDLEKEKAPDDDVDKESPLENVTFQEKPLGSNEPIKSEVLYEFTKIPNVDTNIAEKLFDSGYSNMDRLKEATTEDIAKIDGISPTLARKIRTDLFEMD
jgi:DNA integrity scanning protein DisA with diadenylate cyclase activity